MSQKQIINAVLAGAVACLALWGCDDKGGTKAAADGKADGKGDAKGDAKADDAKAGDEAKADDAKADDAKAAGGDGSIVGTWALDPNAMKEMEEYKNAPPEQQKMMDGLLGSMEMSMTFTDDSMKMTAKLGGETKESEGKYTIKSNEGGKLTIEGEVDGKKEEQTFTLDGDKLIMEDNGQKMVFLRK
jgi:hypothetical protein